MNTTLGTVVLKLFTNANSVALSSKSSHAKFKAKPGANSHSKFATQRTVEALCTCADFADALVTFREAGLSLAHAFHRAVVTLPPTTTSALEVRQILQRMSVGASFHGALGHWLRAQNQRHGDPFVDLVECIDLSLRLGTDVNRALDAAAKRMRFELEAAIAERVAQASVRMLFPVVIFLLPLFFVLLGASSLHDLVSSLGQEVQ